jgi:ATP-binding cassette subfamily F protein uup
VKRASWCVFDPSGTYASVAILLSVRDLSHAFGARPLFEHVSFTVSDGDRIGLIGPNGAGKSTLLKLLAGMIAPDRGEVARRGGISIAYLPQVPELTGASVREAVREGLPRSKEPNWEHEARVDEWISKLDLDPESELAPLSGGWKKRVALARALVALPDLLLLDEPTNHLDVDSIVWLERLLANERFATLTITHDRLFLQRVSNRILELDRRNENGLLDVAGDYADYVEQKAALMEAQERRQQELENTLRRETEWLRRGAAARTTKQQARIQRAEALSGEVQELKGRNRRGSVQLEFDGGEENRPKRLIEAEAVTKRFGERTVFEAIDLLVTPKTRLGLIGPNGCGKSTLLRVLLGSEEPSHGRVFRSDALKVAYFEQNRESLDPELSVAASVCPDGDYVWFRGSHLHRHGYLERFLFRPEQMAQPVRSLSGGEQSRLLVARLMLEPSNLLVLDEPTNDLDLPTLTVLADALESFDGAVLLVSHDRYFLDQVTTQILAFHTAPNELGRVTSLAGLEQWESFHASQAAAARERPKRAESAAPVPKAVGKKKKLSFNEQRDWDTLEARILAAEAELEALTNECARPEVAVDGQRLVELTRSIAEKRETIDRLYARWAELEALL